MASTEPRGLSRAFGQILDIAKGRHPYSFIIPISLWLFDAVLCGLIIWKVPCKHLYLTRRTRLLHLGERS